MKRTLHDKITGKPRVKLTGKDYTALRLAKYAESQGICQCSQATGKPCNASAPWPEGGRAPMPYEGQLAHFPPKRMGNGFGSDTVETTLWVLGYCHNKIDNRGQKVVPKKERA